MKRHIHVVYENGVLRPLEPVNFAERQEFVVIVSDEESVAIVEQSAPRTYSTRSVEQRWIREHRSEYLDQWVVVEGDRLVSHGMDAKAVYKQAREAGIYTPFLVQVTMPDELPWGGW